MFDTKQAIEVSVMHPDGDKTVIVRWPTDEEWIAASKSKKIVFSAAGRGETRTEVEGHEDAAASLLEKIRQSGDELDAAEALYVVERITQTRIDDAIRDGAHIVIAMRVPGADTRHTFRVPSIGELRNYRRNASNLLSAKRGKQIIRVNLQADADLYDKLIVSSEGYVNQVPIAHKNSAIAEMLTALDEANSPEL